MLTKLTLSIDDTVILAAKTYAQKRKRSVSRLVEEYLRNISSSESENTGKVKLGPVTKSISGMFKDEYKGESYDDLLLAALNEKLL